MEVLPQALFLSDTHVCTPVLCLQALKKILGYFLIAVAFLVPLKVRLLFLLLMPSIAHKVLT